MYTFSELKKELDKYVIGQDKLKNAIITAVIHRYLRMNSDDPKNYQPINIMVKGPSGSGKTYTLKVLAEILGVPVYSTAATQYSETGYVGKNIEDIVVEMVDMYKRQEWKKFMKKYIDEHYDEMLNFLASLYMMHIEKYGIDGTIFADRFQHNNDNHQINENEQVSNQDSSLKSLIDDVFTPFNKGTSSNKRLPSLDDISKELSNPDSKIWNDVISATLLKEIKATSTMDKMMGNAVNIIPMQITKPLKDIIYDVAEHIIHQNNDVKERFYDELAERVQYGIVFIDEIDKLIDPDRSERVSRGGVQNALLKLLSGTEIFVQSIGRTIDTSNMLFISAGAFVKHKISDLKDELVGRFHIKVTINELSADEYFMILKNAKNSFLEQQTKLLANENIFITFEDEVLRYIADVTYELNRKKQLGARRLAQFITDILSWIICLSNDKDSLIEHLNKNKIEYVLDGDKIYITFDLKSTKSIIDETAKSLEKEDSKKQYKI